MRAVGMAAAGAVAGWVGGLLIIVVVRLSTGMLMPVPVTLKGLEIVLCVAGIVGGLVLGSRQERAGDDRGPGPGVHPSDR